jgi:predicted transcriptional regulator
MIEQLFGSKTRVKILKHFFKNPEQSYFVRELTRELGEQINSVRRELMNLATFGIIKSSNADNKVFYMLNKHHDNYEGLKLIFTSGGVKDIVEKDSNGEVYVPTYAGRNYPIELDEPQNDIYREQEQVEPSTKKIQSLTKKRSIIKVRDTNSDFLSEKLNSIPNVQLVYISGQLLRSPGIVDMLIVGGIKSKIKDSIEEIEEHFGQSINFIHLTIDDFIFRRRINDRSISAIFQYKTELIINKNPELIEKGI